MNSSVFCIPTDTCYGLAAELSSIEGYADIYRLKGRDFTKPLAFVVRTFDEFSRYADFTREQMAFLREYPYPFTVLAVPKNGAPIPEFLDAAQYRKIALRVGERCVPADIANALPFPFFLTSANRSGDTEARTAEECLAAFGPDVRVMGKGIADRPASDIFEFEGKTTGLRYVRRNYEGGLAIVPNSERR
ncbi:MAG: hypothetical protein QG650_122 [Patescibacteria group bacterium]|nr:hypothetical protein [Patescibacteria group bacterium]